jgi:hypothetical protein
MEDLWETSPSVPIPNSFKHKRIRTLVYVESRPQNRNENRQMWKIMNSTSDGKIDKIEYEHIKKRIQEYFKELNGKEKTNPFLIWTESDLQSYLYHRLISDPNLEKNLSITNRPVLSSVNPEKKYKGKGKNVKPFYQPDFLITPFKNLKVEQRDEKPLTEKRLELINKTDSVVVEIKFTQDTNGSTGRKSVSKLKELKADYEKNLKEGHGWIILVFVEKGEKSYFTKEDVKQMSNYKDALVMHTPKESLFY